MIQKGYYEPPCFRSFLDLEDLLLYSSLVLGREGILWCITLLYKLCARSIRCSRVLKYYTDLGGTLQVGWRDRRDE